MINSPPGMIEVFLNPGEYYFGDAETRIRTILGSCVSVTLWHPTRKIGGMCHYMLPERKRDGPSPELDGRYADEALLLLQHEIIRAGSVPQEYEAKLFGAGNMFPERVTPDSINVPSRNAAAAVRLLEKHGFQLKAHHLGGSGHRTIVFDIWSGDVWVKHRQNGMEVLEPPSDAKKTVYRS